MKMKNEKPIHVKYLSGTPGNYYISLREHNKIVRDLKKEIFDKVENCIIRPYEGTLQDKSKGCVDLHRRILDSLREWFDKLRKEYDYK